MMYVHIWERFLAIMLVLLVMSKCVPMNGESHAKNVTNLRNTSILMKTAEQKGYVKVIVQLIVPELKVLQKSLVSAENPATRTQIKREIEGRIADVADSVLNQIENTYYKVNRRYRSLPLLALYVSPEALVILQSSPDVLKISEDKLSPLNQKK
jgi:hypothetical protein